MRIKVFAFAASIPFAFNCWAGILQTPASSAGSPQAVTQLTRAFGGLTGSIAVNDVTLSGNVERVAGSDDETGTVIFKGLNGTYRLDMAFRNGTLSEIVSSQNGVPTGNWIGPDGTSHAMAMHNLKVDQGWFPLFMLQSLISSPNSILAYVGQETRNEVSVIHISAVQSPPVDAPDDVASLMQHLTQQDIYLDAVNHLPISYVFNSHSDSNATVDIPTEIRYSNYQTVGGLQIPMHVQKFVNNNLALDLQFQTALPNSGITSAQVAAQ
jgi:hypothetical protein